MTLNTLWNFSRYANLLWKWFFFHDLEAPYGDWTSIKAKWEGHQWETNFAQNLRKSWIHLEKNPQSVIRWFLDRIIAAGQGEERGNISEEMCGKNERKSCESPSSSWRVRSRYHFVAWIMEIVRQNSTCPFLENFRIPAFLERYIDEGKIHSVRVVLEFEKNTQNENRISPLPPQPPL